MSPEGVGVLSGVLYRMFSISTIVVGGFTLIPSCHLSCVVDVDLFFIFLLLLPFFDFDLDIVCFVLCFSCGYYAVSSVSVSAATRLAYYIMRILIFFIRTLISPFCIFCLRCTICFIIVILCIILCFYGVFVFLLR